DRRQAFVDRTVLDLGLMRLLALAATASPTATTARAAAAAFVRHGDLVEADVLSRLVLDTLGRALGPGSDGVDRVEPDVGILQRRRAAAHPGVDVAFAFLAHAATAATPPTAASAAA